MKLTPATRPARIIFIDTQRRVLCYVTAALVCPVFVEERLVRATKSRMSSPAFRDGRDVVRETIIRLAAWRRPWSEVFKEMLG